MALQSDTVSWARDYGKLRRIRNKNFEKNFKGKDFMHTRKGLVIQVFEGKYGKLCLGTVQNSKDSWQEHSILAIELQT